MEEQYVEVGRGNEKHCVHSHNNDTKLTEIYFTNPKTTLPVSRLPTSRFVLSNRTRKTKQRSTRLKDPSIGRS